MRSNTNEAKKLFERYLREHGIHASVQRNQILETFLKVRGHLTADEIYALVRKQYPHVGYATVHRAMKLICEAGIGQGIKFSQGGVRYEVLYGHQHHYHLVCVKCGAVLEAINPAIAELQEEMSRQFNFTPTSHRLLIYGTCQDCNYLNKEPTKRIPSKKVEGTTCQLV